MNDKIKTMNKGNNPERKYVIPVWCGHEDEEIPEKTADELTVEEKDLLLGNLIEEWANNPPENHERFLKIVGANPDIPKAKSGLSVGDYVIAPEGCESYLTPWKSYEVLLIHVAAGLFGDEFKIVNDNGDWSYCRQLKCLHLKGKDWLINPL